MYLGLIHVVNTHHEHRRGDRDEGQPGGLLRQLICRLEKMFRRARTGADERPGKQS